MADSTAGAHAHAFTGPADGGNSASTIWWRHIAIYSQNTQRWVRFIYEKNGHNDSAYDKTRL